MDNTLLGVIIGGVLASTGTVLTILFQDKRWKIETRIKILERKRKRLVNLSQNLLIKLSEGMEKNIYSSDMMSDIDLMFPDSVAILFKEYMQKRPKESEDKKFTYYNIAKEMKKAIIEIDQEIEKITQ